MDSADILSYIQIFICLVVFLGLIHFGPRYLLDRRLKNLAAHLSVKGNTDFSLVTSGWMYFGSLLGTYNGVYIELVVEEIETEMSWVDGLFLSHMEYRSKPFLCYTIDYKGQRRYEQFAVFDAVMNFEHVQQTLLKDLEELLTLNINL
jgi:hypothetical protein